jgi:hypothetical protein
MKSKILQLIPFLFTLMLAASGCSEGQQFQNGVCSERNDCPIGAACRGGLCVCISDEACSPGEECNSQGLCQKLSGCRRNSQCPDPNNTFCDLSTGRCIDKVTVDNTGVRSGCGSNVHCDTGYVCDTGNNKCVEGCFADSDCPLYRVCQGAGNGQAGSCLAGICADNSYCEYGQLCTSNGCIDSPNPNHCAPCTGQDPAECGGSANYCLINASYIPGDPASGSQYYCGVNCESNPDQCPNGYGCNSIRILTQEICTTNSQCCDASNAGECCPDGSLDCPDNKRACTKGEGELTGGCTCLTNDDCRIDTYGPQCLNTCEKTGASCIADSDCKSCGGRGFLPCNADADCIIGSCQPTTGDSCSGASKKCQWPLEASCNSATDCEPLPFCVPLQGTQTCIWDIGGTQCNNNAECMCNQNTNTCMGTGRPCTTGADCQLTCQGGGCIIGAACGPNEGLGCPDLLQ